MSIGKKIVKGLALLSLGLAAGWASAQIKYAEGKDYVKLPVPMAASAPKGKVEVIEFFWYGCPHCYRLQKPWEKWMAENANAIAYKPQPAILGKTWEVMARAHHAMVGSGGFDPMLHRDFFTAIHEKNLPLQTLEGNEPKALFAFVAKEKGKDYAEKFKKEYSVFSMGAKIAKDREMQASYRIEGTPTIVVGGKYSVNPGMSGGEAAMVPVVDFLVKKIIFEAKK